MAASRSTSNLPQALDDDLERYLGAAKATVLYHLFVNAVRDIEAGLVEPPPRRTARRGERGPTVQVRWAQPAEEWAQCKRILEAAETSVAAVLERAVRAYVAAEGNILRMPRPAGRSLQHAS